MVLPPGCESEVILLKHVEEGLQSYQPLFNSILCNAMFQGSVTVRGSIIKEMF